MVACLVCSSYSAQIRGRLVGKAVRSNSGTVISGACSDCSYRPKPARLLSVFLRDLAYFERAIDDPRGTELSIRASQSELRGTLISEKNDLEVIATQVEERRLLGNELLERMARELGEDLEDELEEEVFEREILKEDRD